MKKFLSLFLSLCLAMGLATQAFALSTDVRFRSEYDAGGSGLEDILDVIVPAEILLHMNQDGDVQVSRTLAIENRSAKAVAVKSIRVEGKNGWDIVDYNSDFFGKPADTKDLALSFRGDGTDDAGDIVPTPRNWDISAGDSILINAAAKMPTQAGTDRTGIATVYWVIDWADDNGGVDQPENPDVGKYPIDVSVNDGEHGKADADKITTDDEGRILQFPGVTSDPGYIHDGWENQDGNPVDETTKFNPGDEIWPTFKPDSDYNPDKTVTVPVLPGDYGSAGVDSVMTDSDGKINSYPDVTPEPGWLSDGYVDQDGSPVDENTVFEDGDSIKPVFKADPDYKPDLTVTVEVLPGDHGRSPSTSVTTDSDGKIRAYPGVNADDGYVFDHWMDRNGNPVDENTVFKRGDAIIPVFVDAPIEDVTVSFAASQYNGTISGNTSPVTVPVGTKWSEITKPTTNVGAQAAFMGWYAGSTALTDDFELTSDIIATAEFKSWYTYEGTTVTGFSDAWTKSGSPTDIRIPHVIDGIEMNTVGRIDNVEGVNRTTKFTSVYVEDGYTAFGRYAFAYEPYIKSFRFPDTLETIGNSALNNVGGKTDGALGVLILPSGLKSIDDYGFEYSGWTRITVPNGCVVSSSDVFAYCNELTYLKIGEGTSDFSYTFHTNKSLETLVLPATTRTFQSGSTFMLLPKLKDVYIYAFKSSVPGSANPNSSWALNRSGMAPNATITWVNG